MSRAVLIERQSHSEQDTACGRHVKKGGLSQHIFRLIYQKGTTIQDSELEPQTYCKRESEKQLSGQKGRDPVSVCKRRPELHHTETAPHTPGPLHLLVP